MICECQSDHREFSSQYLADLQEMDPDLDQAWFFKCDTCGSLWLRLLFEAPHYPGGNHWYDGLLPQDFDMVVFLGSKENIARVFKESPCCFHKGISADEAVRKFQGLPKRLI